MTPTHDFLLALAACLAGALITSVALRRIARNIEADARRKAHEEFDKRWAQRRTNERKETLAEIVKLRPDEHDLAEDFRNRRKALARANPHLGAAND